MSKQLIRPKDSKLIKAINLRRFDKNNGALYNLHDLRINPEIKKFGLKKPDLFPSYVVDVNPRNKRGGRVGHYHNKKKEIFIPFGPLFLFVSDLEENREIIDINPDNTYNIGDKSINYFSVIYIPTEISHLVYNPTDQIQKLLVLSQTSDIEAEIKGDIIEFDAIGGNLEKILKEII